MISPSVCCVTKLSFTQVWSIVHALVSIVVQNHYNDPCLNAIVKFNNTSTYILTARSLFTF